MMANESPNPANSVDHQLYWFDPLFKPCTSHRNSPNKRNHETSIPASLFWTLHFSLLLQLLKAVNKRQESLRKELSNEIIGHRETQISLENLRSTLGSYILEIEFAERQISLEEERCKEAFRALEECNEALETERFFRSRSEETALRETQRREQVEEKLLIEVRLREEAEKRALKESRLRQVEEEKVSNERNQRIELEQKAIKVNLEKEEAIKRGKEKYFFEYSSQEIVLASNNFHVSRRLETDEWGFVYKGELHHIPVMIRVLDLHGSDGRETFRNEVGLLSRIHHPHIVMMLGACPNNTSIVYEYMSNRNLEHHLSRKSGAPPLPWYVRFRICFEVTAALLFLHSLPENISHGDLNLKNIFLDQSFISKIGNVGIAKLFYRLSNIGTVEPLASIDHESDAHALGITMLRLLTGLPADQVVGFVGEALDNGQFDNILDVSAGEWPLVEAMELACLSLELVELRVRNQDDWMEKMMETLEKIRVTVDERMANENQVFPQPPRGSEQSVPSYFLCPITQEIMEDPCIAADGFTYERYPISAWLQNHNNSPMTNLRLTHKDLISNLSLRSAINEWRGTH